MKKKSLQKMSRLFAAAVLVGTMCLGNVANVNAANGEPNKWTESQEAKAAITVEYKMGKSVDTPANTVSFLFALPVNFPQYINTGKCAVTKIFP